MTESSAPFPLTLITDRTCPSAGGIEGIESDNGKTCCLTSCGQCGGRGCSDSGDASDCCESIIQKYGEACSVSGTAPCYIDSGKNIFFAISTPFDVVGEGFPSFYHFQFNAQGGQTSYPFFSPQPLLPTNAFTHLGEVSRLPPAAGPRTTLKRI